jgi:hypothetical protein
MMRGTAKERIPYGALVLCRNFNVVLAPKEIANGTARPRPKWEWSKGDYFEPGDFLLVEPIEGLGGRDLHAIAAGPIMEPTKLYLPAGKLTEAEYQERLKLDFERAGITDRKLGPTQARV